MNPEEDICQKLHDDGVGVKGHNLFRGPLNEMSGDEQIAVLYIGGVSTGTATGQGGEEHTTVTVQIIYRTPRDLYSRARADLVYSAIHRQEPSNYLEWWCEHPSYLEKDENGRHMWSINVNVEYYQ